MPAVKSEELKAARLSLASPSHQLDNVFREGSAGPLHVASAPRWRKTGPAVAEKTPAARQKAKLIAGSNRRCRATEEDIYACVVKPKAKRPQQIEELVSLQERFTGKSLNDIRIFSSFFPHLKSLIVITQLRSVACFRGATVQLRK